LTHRLTLLCHGRSTARPSAFPADEPLADGEREKIVELVARLGRCDRVLSSPAQAARQTAELFDENFAFDQALVDIHHGRWAGRKIADVQASEPEALAEWMADPDFAPDGGESPAMLLARISAWLADRRSDKGHTIAVTHPHVLRTAMISILGASMEAGPRIDIQHLSTVDLRSDGQRWTLRSLGRL
jgi:broad specificity phosphatase PhoE